MACFNGNQYLFAFGAANNSTNNFSNGFAAGSNNNAPHNGAYGTTPNYVPTQGGVSNAPPQSISMGYSGFSQPMNAGMGNNQQQPQGVSMGYPAFTQPMAAGMGNNQQQPQGISIGYPAFTQPMAAGMNNNQQQLQGVSMGHPGFSRPMFAGMSTSQQPPQSVPMGHPGLAQSMYAGTATIQQMRPPVAQHPNTQGVSAAYRPPRAFMPRDMRTGMPAQMAQSVAGRFPATGISMATGAQYAAQQAGMRMNAANAYPPSGCAAPPHQAVPAQQPTAVSAPMQMGYGAFSARPAPTGNNAAIVPAARRAAPSVFIDLTNDDDEPVGAAPTTMSSMPATQHAGTKRARAESTSKKSSTPVKKPRYTRMEASALPTPPSSSSVIQPLPNSSSSSASSAEVLPATPSPVKPQPTPSKKRADPHNILGGFYHTHVAKPVNRYIAQSDADEADKIIRPVYTASTSKSKKGRSGKQPKKTPEPSEPKTKGSGKSPKTPEPAHPAEADEYSDAEFELDDEYSAPGAVEPTAPAANPLSEEQQQESATASGSDALTITPPAEGRDDEFEEIAIDDDGRVICRPDGMPVSLTEWNAQQAATPSDETLVLQEPAQRAPSPLFGSDDDEGNGDLATQLGPALATADDAVVSQEPSQRALSPLFGSDDEDGSSDDEDDESIAAQFEAFMAAADKEEAVVSQEPAQPTPSPLFGSDDEDDGSDEEVAASILAQLNAAFAASVHQDESSDGEEAVVPVGSDDDDGGPDDEGDDDLAAQLEADRADTESEVSEEE